MTSSVSRLKLNHIRKIALLTLCLLSIVAGAYAFNSSARNALLKSRDQVADQRYQLEKACNDLDRQIDELQQKKYSLGRYLQDCDRSLKEIDNALAAQDSAYRDIH